MKPLQKYLLLAPLGIWLLLFMVLPYAFVLVQSFLETDMFSHVLYHFNLNAYQKVLSSEVYYRTLLHTFVSSIIVAFICILVSMPLAYFIAFKATRYKALLYALIVLPFWMSYIVKAYAWKIILGQSGILNSFLMYVGIIDDPVQFFLYSDFATIICLVYILTPFVAIPIYSAFEQIPKPLIEASMDLGASKWTSFWNLIWPLSLPGIVSGGTFALVLSMGDFLSASLMGGPNTLMVGNLVTSLFGTSNDRPVGSVIGVIMFFWILLLLIGSSRVEKKYSTYTS